MSEPRVRVWVCQFSDRRALQLQWVSPDTGKRKTKSARTDNEDEAEAKRADLEYELNHGLYAEPSRLTWAAFRTAFELEYVAPLRQSTRSGYTTTFKQFEEDMTPGLLSSITQRTVSVWVAVLRKRLQPSSIVIRLEHLRAALKWAAEQDLLVKVPKFPRIDVPQRTPQPVPAELFDRLLLAAGDDQEMRAYLLCGWLAGLRAVEAASLSWEESDRAPWVDFDRDRIVFSAAACKGNRDQWVPLDPQLRVALLALLALPRSAPTVFHDQPRTWTERMQLLAGKAGVRLTMRSLRRGFACRHAARVPAQVLQRLMRHADIQTTMAYYCNVDEAAMEAILGPRRPNPPAAPAPTEERQGEP